MVTITITVEEIAQGIATTKFKNASKGTQLEKELASAYVNWLELFSNTMIPPPIESIVDDTKEGLSIKAARQRAGLNP